MHSAKQGNYLNQWYMNLNLSLSLLFFTIFIFQNFQPLHKLCFCLEVLTSKQVTLNFGLWREMWHCKYLTSFYTCLRLHRATRDAAWTLYCAHLVSPWGGAFATFALPGGWALALLQRQTLTETKINIKMFKVTQLDCPINAETPSCNVDWGLGICPLFSSPLQGNW